MSERVAILPEEDEDSVGPSQNGWQKMEKRWL